jgi:hypothetical protein
MGLPPSLVVLLTTASVVAQQAQTRVTVARWPQDRSVAISLTFDDAMATILIYEDLFGTFKSNM